MISSTNIDNVKLNEIEYDNSDKKISVGNNSYLVMPVYVVTEDGHLLVSNLHLAAHAKDGVVRVETNNEAFEVTLNGLDNGDTLELNKAFPLFTKKDRINEVTVDGLTITQVSNNGSQGLGIMLEADGALINDPAQLIYTLKPNGDMGITTPEKVGYSEVYTYGTYLKYTGKDFTAADVGIYSKPITLILPGKGNITINFVLEAQEYTA